MKKSGPAELAGTVKDKDEKALEAGAVERKDTDADPVDGPKMSTADRIAMAKTNAKEVPSHLNSGSLMERCRSKSSSLRSANFLRC